MTLQELVLEARQKDKKFNKLIKQRILTKSYPPLPWLMSKLESVLGRDYCEKAAREHIEKSQEVDEQTSSR